MCVSIFFRSKKDDLLLKASFFSKIFWHILCRSKKAWQGLKICMAYMHRRFLGTLNLLNPQKTCPIWRSKTAQIRHILPGLHWQWSQAHHGKQAPLIFGRKCLWTFTDDMPKCMNKNQELPNFGCWFDFRDFSEVWPLIYGMNQFFIDIGRGIDVAGCFQFWSVYPGWLFFFFKGGMKYYSVIYRDCKKLWLPCFMKSGCFWWLVSPAALLFLRNGSYQVYWRFRIP